MIILIPPTYCQTVSAADKSTFRKLKSLMKKHGKYLTKKEFTYITDFDWQICNIYVQPKIHKNKTIIDAMKRSKEGYLEMDTLQDLNARPIIAGPNAPTQHFSELIEKIISPLVPHLKSYIKDDWDFRRKLPSHIEYSSTLYSCDIVSLHTNITHELGLTALEYYIDKYRTLLPSRFTKAFMLEIVAFILNNNNFFFDNIIISRLAQQWVPSLLLLMPASQLDF